MSTSGLAYERYTLGNSHEDYAAVHPPMGHFSVGQPTTPDHVLAIDFTKLDTASDGREKVLVMADVFTKYTLCSSPHQEPGGGDGRAGPRPGLSGSAATESQNASTVTRAETLNRAW